MVKKVFPDNSYLREIIIHDPQVLYCFRNKKQTFMKTNNVLLLLCLALISFSCKEDDKLSNINNDADFGAVVEIVSTETNSLSTANLEGALKTSLEYRDAENGTLLENMKVYITFRDFTQDEGDSSGALVNQEVLLRTIDAANFSNGANNFPVTDLNINAEDFLNTTNNTLSSIAAGDDFLTRLELTLTDGRVFSTNNISDNGGLNSDFSIITKVQ